MSTNNSMLEEEVFVIAIVENKKIQRYFAVDPISGGYPWFPKNFSNAKKFTSKSAAVEVLDELKVCNAAGPRRFSDGTLYPDAIITSALEMGGHKHIASGQAIVCKVLLTDWESVAIDIGGEIKKATGFTYPETPPTSTQTFIRGDKLKAINVLEEDGEPCEGRLRLNEIVTMVDRTSENRTHILIERSNGRRLQLEKTRFELAE